MFAEWPPPHTELTVIIGHTELAGTFPGVIVLDDYSWAGGIEPLLGRQVVNGLIQRIAALSPQERKRLEWTARWLPDELSTLEVHHRIDHTIQHLRPDDDGRYRFTEEHGFYLTDDLPPLADFLVARARLRADRDGKDVFDGADERHTTARRAIDALGTAAREVYELALVGLDDADRLKDHALLTEALTRTADPAGLGSWLRKDIK